jgi:hypothetical protein
MPENQTPTAGKSFVTAIFMPSLRIREKTLRPLRASREKISREDRKGRKV